MISWALERDAAVSLAGECGCGSVTTVDLLGESAVLRCGPDLAATLVHEPWDEPERVVARGLVSPRQLRRALGLLGY